MTVAPRSARLSSATGERLGGFIYGTILVLAVVVAGAKAYPEKPGYVAALVVVTSFVFWLAHVYAHGLAHSVTHGEHLSMPVLVGIARHEAAIMEATVPPVAALVLGTLELISNVAAVWTAIGLGLLVLTLAGIFFARVEKLGWLGTLVVVSVNLGLGVLLITLKIFVTH
jgi:hypothetical protein